MHSPRHINKKKKRIIYYQGVTPDYRALTQRCVKKVSMRQCVCVCARILSIYEREREREGERVRYECKVLFIFSNEYSIYLSNLSNLFSIRRLLWFAFPSTKIDNFGWSEFTYSAQVFDDIIFKRWNDTCGRVKENNGDQNEQISE